MNRAKFLRLQNLRLAAAMWYQDSDGSIQDPPSLLNRLESRTVQDPSKSLLDRIQTANPMNEMSLFKRISTELSTTVEKEKSPNPPLLRNYSTPWNESPPSHPTSASELSSPSSPKSPQSTEKIMRPLTLLERLSDRPSSTMKRKMSMDPEMPQSSRRRMSLNDSSKVLLNDQLQQTTPKKKLSLHLNDNVSDSQTCRGMDYEEPEHLSTTIKAVPERATYSSSTERTCQEASSSYGPHPVPPKEFRPPNGSGSFVANPSISTISCLQLSTLQSMRIARRALEKHNSHLLRAKQNGKSEVRVTGWPLGNELHKPSFSPSRTEKTSLTSTPVTSKLNLMLNIPLPTNVSSSMTLQLETTKENDVGLQPKYLRYNLWGADHQKLMTTADWSEFASPLPRPPDTEFENPISASTLSSYPHLFKVDTPLNVDHFETLLADHPNPAFVRSILTGLWEGFWPWANTHLPGYPETHHQPPNGVYDDAQLSFFCTQLQHEQDCGRYSPSIGSSLLPGMYCMPIYGVPKPHSDALRLVNDHSAGAYSLNSMVDHSQVIGYPLDNLHLLGRMLLDHHDLTPGQKLVMWKSDISEAYRICPMHPLWQMKQAVCVDGEYYVDQANCFGNSSSFAIFISVNSLITWIAHKERGISFLITYVDDSSGPAIKGDVEYYNAYKTFYPTPQTKLLRLWDELGIPHKESKQLHGETLPIIGILVDPNALSFSLPLVAREQLTMELETWVSEKSSR